MTKRLPTVRVESFESPSGYLTINASEFDANIHKVHASNPEDGEYDPDPIPAAVIATRDAEATIAAKRPATIRIVSDEVEGGFMTINVSDFDESMHEQYVDATDDLNAPNLPDVPQDLAALSFADLRAEAKRLGLKASGTRADLQSAILEHLTRPDTAPASVPSSDAPASTETAS